MISECSFYCTGDSYHLNNLAIHLMESHIESKIYNKEVIHIRYPVNNIITDVFVYSYGCIVFWGISDLEAEEITKEFSRYILKPLPKYIIEKCSYQISASNESFTDVENDVIVLHHSDELHLLKLSFSYGLSQSVKLNVFEESVDKTIEANNSIPHDLIHTGKILMSKRELAQKIGFLLAEKNYINLQNNILDTPEFFWKRSKYEQYYQMSIKFQDLPQRISILNSKLEIIEDLYSILSNELQHAHSSRLEMVIIILIFIEIVIGIIELIIW